MIRRIIPLFLGCLAVFVAGCRRADVHLRPTIPYVSTILAGGNDEASRIVRGFGAPAASGAIYLVGEPAECSELGKALLECDAFDNVDGRLTSDGLADFAGETVVCVADYANTPYRGFVDAGNETFLRETAVRNVLAVMDTLCYVSPYDRSGMGSKRAPKLVVLTSSYMASHGLFDVDTLLRSLSCPLPVISPLSAMMEDALAYSDPSMVGVLARGDGIDSGIYSATLAQKAREAGKRVPECVVFAPEPGADPLLSFLDKYLAAGYDKPLDALIVDDLDVDMVALVQSLGSIASVMNEGFMTYGKALGAKFRMPDPRAVVIQRCYRMLRERNLFTHAIAQPRMETLMIRPRPDLPGSPYGADGYFTDQVKYGRASDVEVNTTMLLQYSSLYLPQTSTQDVQN